VSIEWTQSWQQLKALIPVEDKASGGNFTQVLLAGKEPLLEKRKTSTVRRELARFLLVDERAAKDYGRKILVRRRVVPLVYNQGLVLIPLWMRLVLLPDKGAHGYVNLLQLAGPEPKKTGQYRSRLIFQDGTTVDCVNTSEHVSRMMDMAVRLKEHHFEFIQGRLDLPVKSGTCRMLRPVSGCSG
jgi:hypothetical protein